MKQTICATVSMFTLLLLMSAIPAHAQTYNIVDTGQTRFYSNSAVISAPSEGQAFYGQDAQYAGHQRSYTDNGDGTVTDNCTGLTWQQATAAGTYSWAQALRYCEDLELGGETDWRLPNVRELQSIVDYGRYNPAIDPVFSAESSWCWSSSSHVGHVDFAWFVRFHDGFVNDIGKHAGAFVRAVRGGL